MAGIFKAYDVRGTYPDQIDETIAYKIGLAFQHVLDEADRGGTSPVVVSRDMRSHSAPLARALVSGLRDGGLDVVDVGLATTPMNYFAVGHLEAAGGVQVTASHNPSRYNGFKFSLRDARPVSGDHGIPLLESKVLTGDLPHAGRKGSYATADVADAYRRHVLSFVEPGQRLRVAVDAANGMGTIYRPILEAMDLELVPLYFELDGSFPNHEANPLRRENLRDLERAVREHGAALGVAFDGDADRAGFVDEHAEPIGSDLITALVAGEMLRHHPGRAVLYDLRSSRAVAEHIEASGGIPVRERVGHSFMKATLRARHGIFGGELAGHYYFADTYHADSSLRAATEVVNLLRRTGRPLSELVRPLRRYAKSEEINFEVDDKAGKMRELAERYSDGAIDRLDGVTVQYPDWWFNVRPSNTEPLLRLVVEASTEEALAEREAELVGLLGHRVDH
jgi:phosphomannomutase